MGIQWPDGYSATVESHLIVQGIRYRLAKGNGATITLDEDCELAPGTMGRMVITVDGDPWVRTVVLPDGARLGQRKIRYCVDAPF